MDDKSGLIEALDSTRQRTLELVCSLPTDQLCVPYHPGVNPPVWEMGHSAFFYEVFILQALDKVDSYDPAMDEIWDSFHLDHSDRWSPALFPSREKTLQYFNAVYDAILARIRNRPLTDDELYLYKYAIFHQNMHIESMIWCRQTVGYARPPGAAQDAPEHSGQQPPLGDATVPAGTYVIGIPARSGQFARTDFAFDNEKPRFEVTLAAFDISRTLVSNREFLDFVEAGGYERETLWSQGGRKWLRTETDSAFGTGAPPQMATPKHPLYWKRHEGAWLERHFDRWLPLKPDHPVTHVSFWEAEAFCNWAGRRLPTEYEWEAAALGNRKGRPFRRYPWGNAMDPAQVDMDGVHLARVPVSAYPEGDSVFGCRQMLGTVWEWTSSQFLPYDGFAVDMYPFMSTLQFGSHKTTRGGSCATSSLLIRGTYRQAYMPDRTDVFVGFRTCAT
jgi:iron(II)-dependent oxidoreductase